MQLHVIFIACLCQAYLTFVHSQHLNFQVAKWDKKIVLERSGYHKNKLNFINVGSLIYSLENWPTSAHLFYIPNALEDAEIEHLGAIGINEIAINPLVIGQPNSYRSNWRSRPLIFVYSHIRRAIF